jgi:hypothetical protein
VEIVCTTCYIKGTATAQFTISGNFNFSQAFHNVTSEVETEADNITMTAVDYVENYVKSAITSATSDGFKIDDFDFPPIQIDFDIDVPDIPECELQFQFDGMELYMQIDTIISSGATYTLNLYTSKTPIGFTVGEDLLIGVVISVDLILSVEAEIDISSGFHIQLKDGVAINIPMFSQDVSSITFNGGNFEFLPVTIQSAGVVLTALLRVGVKAGLELSTPTKTVDGLSLKFSTGLEVGVWADVAQFVTNVTAAPAGNGSTCELPVVEEYSFLLGANAGATLALGEHTWGPTPNTQIPIWYTTLLDACAVTGSATAAASAAATTIAARDDLTTTTTSTEITYTATACLSTGLVNCPVSLQSTSKNTVTKTLVTAVPSGSEVTFPATVQNTVVSTVAFGTNIQEISATSGSPVSYVPTPSSRSSSVIDGETGGVSNKVIIGVSVGVGVPVLITIVAVCIYCCKRKRSAPIQRAEPTYVGQQDLQIPEPYTPGSYISGKKSPNFTAFEN